MQDEDIDRAVDAATDYVNKQMAPADLVALVSMATGLSMDQDFTADKTALLHGLAKYNGSDETGFANGATGTTDATSDDTSTFAVDDSEYNSLNTDRELLAIRAIAKSLERVDQRKSMLYFSGGLTRSGIENQASLRAATKRSREGEPRNLLGGHARSAGAAAGGRCQQRLAARELRLQRRSGHGTALGQFWLPGDAEHAGGRHRREVLFGLQRLRPGVSADRSTILRPTTSSASTPPINARDGSLPPSHHQAQPQ